MSSIVDGINIKLLFIRVDEVIYPSPWVIDEKFLNDHKIDYVAHDDIPYTTAGIDDAYALCKKLGKFVVFQFLINRRQPNERKVFRHQI